MEGLTGVLGWSRRFGRLLDTVCWCQGLLCLPQSSLLATIRPLRAILDLEQGQWGSADTAPDDRIQLTFPLSLSPQSILVRILDGTVCSVHSADYGTI